VSRLKAVGRRLRLPSGRHLEFDFPVAEVLDLGDVAVVRLDIPLGQQMNTNVFGISCEDGRVLWRVPKRRLVYKDSPYTGLRREGAHVTLFNWDGLTLTVDPCTGEVVAEQHGR
jgi:hypothetical protein